MERAHLQLKKASKTIDALKRDIDYLQAAQNIKNTYSAVKAASQVQIQQQQQMAALLGGNCGIQQLSTRITQLILIQVRI